MVFVSQLSPCEIAGLWKAASVPCRGPGRVVEQERVLLQLLFQFTFLRTPLSVAAVVWVLRVRSLQTVPSDALGCAQPGRRSGGERWGVWWPRGRRRV